MPKKELGGDSIAVGGLMSPQPVSVSVEKAFSQQYLIIEAALYRSLHENSATLAPVHESGRYTRDLDCFAAIPDMVHSCG